MNTLRVFFAISPPKMVHASLTSLLGTLKDSFPKQCLKWIEVRNLHITLQFLGNVPHNQLIEIIKSANAALNNITPFQLEFGTVVWFPSLRKPKILSLVVEPQDTLKTVSATIGRALIALNSRPFRGHLTLGKVRRHHHVPQELITKIKIPTITPVNINKIYLVESRPNREGGMSYHNVAEFNLSKHL